MEKGYQVFVLIQLAITKGVINIDLEYDSQWEQGLILYAKFKDSTFNDPNEPEYECVVKFLDGEMNQTFELDVDVVEVNRYTYSVKGKSAEDAMSKLGKYLEHNCPFPSDVNNELGIVCNDREAGRETMEIKSITLNKPFRANEPINADDLPF